MLLYGATKSPQRKTPQERGMHPGKDPLRSFCRDTACWHKAWLSVEVPLGSAIPAHASGVLPKCLSVNTLGTSLLTLYAKDESLPGWVFWGPDSKQVTVTLDEDTLSCVVQCSITELCFRYNSRWKGILPKSPQTLFCFPLTHTSTASELRRLSCLPLVFGD